MSYNVTVVVATTATPSTQTFDHTDLMVTDSAGTQQIFPLKGTESPPWTQAVTVAADGPSTYSAQAKDSSGAAMGPPATATFTPAVPVPFPAPTGITVTAA